MASHVFSLLLYRQVVLNFALCKSIHSFEKLVFCGCIIFNSINIPSKGAWKVVICYGGIFARTKRNPRPLPG